MELKNAIDAILIIYIVYYYKNQIETYLNNLVKEKKELLDKMKENINKYDNILRNYKNESFDVKKSLKEIEEYSISELSKLEKKHDKGNRPDYTLDWIANLFLVILFLIFLSLFKTPFQFLNNLYLILGVKWSVIISIIYLILGLKISQFFYNNLNRKIDIHRSIFLWSFIEFILIIIFWPIIGIFLITKLTYPHIIRASEFCWHKIKIKTKKRFDED